jgi:hypothetical protein
MSAQTFVVGRTDADTTVAAFIRARLDLPWSRAKKMVESGQIKVAGQKIVDPAHRLKIGKRVEVVAPENPNPTKRTTRAKLPDAPKYDGPTPVVVYSDDTLAVIDKPAGLTTNRNADEAAEFGERPGSSCRPRSPNCCRPCSGSRGRRSGPFTGSTATRPDSWFSPGPRPAKRT